MRFAVGVHPHQARECAGQPGRAERLLRDAFASPDVVAVGEIGLDYHYDFSPRDVQHDVFVEQLATARALGAPVAIHTREADEDTFTIARRRRARGVRGVFHCFTGGVARARRALDLGFHLSLAGILTFPKAADLVEVAKFAPADRLLVETDSPFLAPVPHRGKRNEPAFCRTRRRPPRGDPGRRSGRRRPANHREFPGAVCPEHGLRALTLRAKIWSDQPP